MTGDITTSNSLADLIKAAVETAIDNARTQFERLGVLATDDAVAIAALGDPAIEALIADEAATEAIFTEVVQDIVADIPAQRPNEDRSAYRRRVAAAVQAKLKQREHAYRRMRLLLPRKRSR